MSNHRPRSGYATEEMRHTERVSLRLPPDVASRLRRLAEERGETLSECVSRIVRDNTGASTMPLPEL